MIESVNKRILIPTNGKCTLTSFDASPSLTLSSQRSLTRMSSLQNRPYSRPSMLDPTTPHSTSTSQPPARFLPPHILTSRIAEKQAEFESLSQLRELSAGLAAQMENLESKLNCLADGTESTAFPTPDIERWLTCKVLRRYWRIGRMCLGRLISRRVLPLFARSEG